MHELNMDLKKGNDSVRREVLYYIHIEVLATSWKFRRSNPFGGRDFPHRPRPCSAPRLLYNGCRVSFSGV